MWWQWKEKKELRYIHACLPTYSMEQSPSWEANRFSASQENPCILRNPKVQYRIHKCPPYVPNLSQTNLKHASKSHFQRPILILSSHLCLGVPRDLFRSGFPTKTLYTLLLFPHTCYMTHPSNFPRFFHHIGWGVQIIKLLITSN
jgi:hypothetical protein